MRMARLQGSVRSARAGSAKKSVRQHRTQRRPLDFPHRSPVNQDSSADQPGAGAGIRKADGASDWCGDFLRAVDAQLVKDGGADFRNRDDIGR